MQSFIASAEHAIEFGLSARDLADLYASGISDEAILENKIYTEHDGRELCKLLNRRPTRENMDLAPAMVIPLRGPDGEFPIVRVKPHVPRGDRKYLQPSGERNRAYFTTAAVDALRATNSRRVIIITEGEKKGICLAQYGWAVIALTGVWNWKFKPDRKKDESFPLPELVEIDWLDRCVLIIFDTDEKPKFGVNSAAVHLAVELFNRGADVHWLRLPKGPKGLDGRPKKMAIDDFIVQNGIGAFEMWLDTAINDPARTIDIASYRLQLRRTRLDSISNPDIYLDTSPSGSGKTHADVRPILQIDSLGKRALLVHPTHENCRQAERQLKDAGLDAAAYPRLLTKDKKNQKGEVIEERNCENGPAAKRALELGLPPIDTVCQICELKPACLYQELLKDAQNATHHIITRDRARYTLGTDRERYRYVAIHEDAMDLLAPLYKCGGEIDLVARAAEAASKEADRLAAKSLERAQLAQKRMKWARNDRERSECQAVVDRHEAKKDELMQQWEFLRQLATVAQALADEFESASDNEPRRTKLNPDIWPFNVPRGSRLRLFESLDCLLRRTENDGKQADVKDAVQLALAAATGKTTVIMLRVAEAEWTKRKWVKKLIAVTSSPLPENAPVWISDATADPTAIEAAAGRPIVVATPESHIDQHRPVTQFLSDVSRKTSCSFVIRLLRTILEKCTGKQRVGVICHSVHAPAVRGTVEGQTTRLPPEMQDRIHRVEYFYGESSRGINWQKECDLLVVLGTPRINRLAIEDWLLQAGDLQAVCRAEQVGYKKDTWLAETPWAHLRHDSWLRSPEGEGLRAAETSAYDDYDWQRAYTALVIAELRQCIGRARSLCEDGIEAIVATTENLGLPIALDEMQIPTSKEFELLDVMQELLSTRVTEAGARCAIPEQTANRAILTECSGIRSEELAHKLKKSDRQIRKLLSSLQAKGYVKHLGHKLGWMLTAVYQQDFSSGAATIGR